MTDTPLHMTWTLPPQGEIRTGEAEGFAKLCEGVFVHGRLLQQRAFPMMQQVNGKPAQVQVVVRFEGPAARITDGGGVPFPPGVRVPQSDLQRVLDTVARDVNTATAALTTPDPARAVDMLFRTRPERMALPPVAARGRIGRALIGHRFDRSRNRSLLAGFLKEHGPRPEPPDLPGQDAPDMPDDPWLDRLRTTLTALPRLSETGLSLTIDREERLVLAEFRAASHAETPIPAFVAQLDPPGLSAGSAVHGSAETLTRAIAACEVTRAQRLLLHLYPQPDWTLRIRYFAPDEDGEDRALHDAELSDGTSMIDLLAR